MIIIRTMIVIITVKVMMVKAMLHDECDEGKENEDDDHENGNENENEIK